MKQFFDTLIPDKAAAWRMASMTLLLLLVMVLLVNTVVPFFGELFSFNEGQPVGEEPGRLMAESDSSEKIALQKQVAERTVEIEQVNEAIRTISEEKAALERTVAELQELNQAASAELQELQNQIQHQALLLEQLQQQRDQAVAELEALRESLAMDYTVVVRLTRLNIFGSVADTIYISMHVTEEQYATYQVGAKVEPFGDLEYPLDNSWSGEVSKMFVNLKEL